jgi:hypothetical protein
LVQFRPVFTYQASFNWFVIVVVGFLIRFDHMGVTCRMPRFLGLSFHVS